MPQLPKYQSRIGPQRLAPQPVRRDAGAVFGQGLERLGQGISSLGGAIQGLENSQDEMEFQKGKNIANKRWDQFRLALNEDPEFLAYGKKYDEFYKEVQKEIDETLQSANAKKGLDIWWGAEGERRRFEVEKASQNKKLEWQFDTLVETYESIIGRTRNDNILLDDKSLVIVQKDLESLLRGALKNGLIVREQFDEMLEQGVERIEGNSVLQLAQGMSLEGGLALIANAELTPNLEKDDRAKLAEVFEEGWNIQEEQTQKAWDKKALINDREALKAFDAGTLRRDDVYEMFDPPERDGRKKYAEKWIKALRAREKASKDKPPKPIPTDDLVEGEILELTRRENFPRSALEEMINKGHGFWLEGKTKGAISNDDYKKLMDGLDKHKPLPGEGTPRRDVGWDGAVRAIRGSGMTDVEAARGIVALNDYIDNAALKGEKITDKSMVEFAEQYIHKSAEDKLSLALDRLETVKTPRPLKPAIGSRYIPAVEKIVERGTKEPQEERQNLKESIEAWEAWRTTDADEYFVDEKSGRVLFRSGDLWYAQINGVWYEGKEENGQIKGMKPYRRPR